MVASILERCGLAYEFQKRFDGLVGANNCALSYDFFVPSIGLAIEYDGEHHVRPVKFYGNTDTEQSETRFVSQRERDRRKEEFVVTHGFRLVRIRYNDTLESATQRLKDAGLHIPV